MEKINTNDLKDEIFLATKGCTLPYLLKRRIFAISFISFNLTMFNLIVVLIYNVSRWFLFMGLVGWSGAVIMLLQTKMFKRAAKMQEEDAVKDLEVLTTRLKANGVNVDYKCLTEAIEYRKVRNYTTERVDGEKLPRIIQNKHYIVPTNDSIENERKSCYLYQKHQFFPPSDEYILTIEDSEKKMKLVPKNSRNY